MARASSASMLVIGLGSLTAASCADGTDDDRWEMASRLSFLLWGEGPDDALLD